MAIHPCGQAAVVVPVTDFLRLRALERRASADLEGDEDDAALADWQARDTAGRTPTCPNDEVRRLGRQVCGDHRVTGSVQGATASAPGPAANSSPGQAGFLADRARPRPGHAHLLFRSLSSTAG